MKKLIIYAPNVHTGGGRTLLIAMLKAIPSDSMLILDQRLSNLKFDHHNIVSRVKSTFKSRFKAEITLKKIANKGDIILCFHSLPPIFKAEAKVFVYFHNKHLIKDKNVDLPSENTRANVRIFIEKLLAQFFHRNVDEYFVQSSTMKRKFDFYYSKKMGIVTIYPFINFPPIPKEINSKISKKYDFVYISEGPKHKNHKNLLNAWVYLASQNIFPKLALTLSNDHKDEINNINALVEKYDIKVDNLGYVDFDKVLSVYSNSKALIFPSFMESFGLPLIEAKQLGLPILAPELDYVRDICSPAETFDPKSKISIARAVKRFLKIKNTSNLEYDVDSFIDYITK